MKLRLLLADDHALFRKALRMYLETQPDLEVVAEAEDGHGVIEAVRLSLPDVVCMDIRMPGLNGIEATQQLVAAYPAVRVVVVSAHPDLFMVARLVNAGAFAYVLKMNVDRELPLAIRSVSQNQPYFSPELGIGDMSDLAAYGMNPSRVLPV